jgi:hypothetical protein
MFGHGDRTQLEPWTFTVHTLPLPSQEVLEEWLNCQRSWLYLEPIFRSEDITRQLPVESKRYQTMERIWRKIMKNAYENREVSSMGQGGQRGPKGSGHIVGKLLVSFLPKQEGLKDKSKALAITCNL